MPVQPPKGIVTALVTPFRDDDERIDFSAWQRIIDFQIESGVDGLLATGGQDTTVRLWRAASLAETDA